MTSTCLQLKTSQLAWAERRGIAVDSDGYVLAQDDNLFVALSDNARTDFTRGSGGELTGTRRGPAKLSAVHSSAALAYNALEHWRRHNRQVMAAALHLPAPVLEMRFEGQFPTGLDGKPPNVDVALELRDGSCWAIESKFTEPFCSPKSGQKDMKEKYFPPSASLWEKCGLAACSRLAHDIRAGSGDFYHLDAAQLLKHILGLHTCRRTYSLIYLWLDVDSEEGDAHRTEVARFQDVIASEVAFCALTYQTLVRRLAGIAGSRHGAYFTYMRERYMRDVDY